MIGLDIGAYSISAVELKHDAAFTTLLNFKIQRRQSDESLAASLRKFFTEANFLSKETAIAISGPSAIARLIDMPDMNEEELKGAVRFEAEKYAPFNMNGAVLDYQVISRDDKAKKMTIFLAAAASDIITNYINAIIECGYTVVCVDVAGVALTNSFLNALPAQGGAEPFALLNVNASLATISVVYKEVPFVLRDLEVEENEVAPDKLAKELRLSIGYFENQLLNGVEKIYLSAPASRFISLKDFLSDYFEITVEAWDPFSSTRVEAVSQKALEEVKSELAVAAGLGLRND